ncbi:MAG: hypothetical protein WBD32_13965 [Acidobacteriaceae bacterium]
MRSLLPKFVLASAVMLAGALAAAPAMAEVMVNVPFSFTVNGKVCPAGRYQIGHDAASSVVTLRAVNTWSRSFAWIAGSGNASPYDSRVILRFDANGDQHELQSVQFGSMITDRLDRGPRHSEYVPTRDMGGQ